MRTVAEYLGSAFAVVLAFIAPLQTFMLAVGVLIILDMFAGLAVSIKLGDKVTSRRLSNTVSKLILYNVAIITCGILATVFFPGFPVVETCAAFLATIEVKSIDEHMKRAFGFSFYEQVLKVLKREDVNHNKNEDNS